MKNMTISKSKANLVSINATYAQQVPHANPRRQTGYSGDQHMHDMGIYDPMPKVGSA